MRPIELCMAILALACGTLPAQAHPHVWVTTETTVLYDNGTFVGLRHKWTFDAQYSAMAVEGLDKNQDGKYDRDELAELAKGDIEGLHDYSYFTVSALAGEKLKFGLARDYWLEHTDGMLSLHFTLPFERPVPAEAKGLTFSISDPEFYIAFEFAKDNPVKFNDGTPATCKATVRQQEADQALSEALQRQFGAFAVTTSTTAVVDCAMP